MLIWCPLLAGVKRLLALQLVAYTKESAFPDRDPQCYSEYARANTRWRGFSRESSMKESSAAMSAWNRLSGMPGGKWAFSRLVSWKAPYFGSIRAQFEELRPGHSEVRMKKRRAVLNHIGTVHAIAMCNMAELAAGTMTDASVPSTHRWIPKGMTVEYLAKAETDLRAVATLDVGLEFGESKELAVTVKVTDSNDQEVLRANITMWITKKAR